MLDINEYILLSKDKRQEHLKLGDACIERGGPAKGGLSAYCKGLMAHLLDTSIPTGHKIHICHACNNEKCSNPVHLYWGTAQENRLDQIATGRDKSVWERSVEKHGVEKAKELNKKVGNTHGKGNAGKPKSIEHRQKTAESIKLWWFNRKNSGE